MELSILSSHAMRNAPAGYLIARLVLAPGLYVDAEMNPYTCGEWRPCLYLGPEDKGEGCAINLGNVFALQGPIAEALCAVSELYASTYEVRSLLTGERLYHEDGSLRAALDGL